MAEPRNEPVYREVQRWSSLTRSLMLVLCLLVGAAGMTATVVGLEQGGYQWPDVLIGILCGVLVPVAVGLLIWVARLETEVRSDGLYIRYVPFHRHFRRFRTEDLGEHHACTYRPLLEYGGWGIRHSWVRRAWAYSVSGNQGVQIALRNGRRVLVGSARPSDLEAALCAVVPAN